MFKACFANPEREKFRRVKWHSKAQNECEMSEAMDENADEMHEMFIAWNSYKKFNNAKIKVHGSENLILDDVEKKAWVSNLKGLRWYGPLIDDTGDAKSVVFKTATDAGLFSGFVLKIYISFDDKNQPSAANNIELYYLNDKNEICGEVLTFTSGDDEMGG